MCKNAAQRMLLHCCLLLAQYMERRKLELGCQWQPGSGSGTCGARDSQVSVLASQVCMGLGIANAENSIVQAASWTCLFTTNVVLPGT